MKKIHQQSVQIFVIITIIILVIFLVVSQNNKIPAGGGQHGTVPANITAPSEQNSGSTNPDQSA